MSILLLGKDVIKMSFLKNFSVSLVVIDDQELLGEVDSSVSALILVLVGAFFVLVAPDAQSVS